MPEFDPKLQDLIYAALFWGMGIGIFIGWIIGAFTAIVCLHRQEVRSQRANN